MALMLLAIAALLMTSPSTTMTGSTPPLMVETPRRLICAPPPGAPEFDWMRAPAILPWSALSIVGVGARWRSCAVTTLTAWGRFFCSTAVA